MDIDHIEWMMKDALLVCEKEKLDDSLLMPLVILHDVGYSKVKKIKTANYYSKDIRRTHMEAGKEIAIKVLRKLKYPEDKTEKIAYYVSVHDNWAYGEVDLFVNDQILGTFKDLDYIWIFTPQGFRAHKMILNKTNRELLEHLRKEPSPIGGKKPFSNPTTKKLHDDYLKDREKEVSGIL